MKLLIGFGTRPEWNKIKPLVSKLEHSDIHYELLFTSQHTDLVEELPKHKAITIRQQTDNRLNNIVIGILSQNIFEDITHVLVQGDTSSAFAIALSAFHHKIPIIHLEAGMRTQTNSEPWPEEFNRRSIAVMASIHLCPTEREEQNLIAEKIDGLKYVVGNTSLDNIAHLKNQVAFGNKVLITLHRRENHDRIREWFEALEELAVNFPQFEFVFPMHPSPQIRQYRSDFEKVKVVEPMNHQMFVQEMLKSCCIITDSGGVQEEAAFLSKRVLVCRQARSSERKQDRNSIFVPDPDLLFDTFKNEIGMFEKWQFSDCPYGDGNTSQQVVDILRSMI